MEKFERKIYVRLAILFACFLPVIALGFFSLKGVINEQNELVSSSTREMLLAERLRFMDSVQSGLMPAFVLSGRVDLIDSFERAHANFNEALEELKTIETDQRSHDLLVDLRQLTDRRHAYALPGIQMVRDGKPTKSVEDYFREQTGPLTDTIRKEMNELVQREADDFEAAKSRVSGTVGRIMSAFVALSVVTIAFILVIGSLVISVIRQKRAYDESQEAVLARELRLSQARKETVEVVSHDLKNPLGTVKVSLQMALYHLNDPTPNMVKDALEYLQIASRSTDSMERLIKDLLDHAKIEAGHLVLDRRETDLSKLIGDLGTRFGLLAKERGIALTMNGGESTMVACDSGRIEQVISNLLGNAVKFTPHGGRIHLNLQREKNDVFVSVEDSGPGLTEAQCAKIFDRFWQVRETAHKGNGLGLSIAKAIVEAHGGAISVISKPGQGSKFFFVLPVAATEAVVPPDHAPLRSAPSANL